MRRKSMLLSVIVCIGFLFGASQASAIPVDLRPFTPFPGDAVSIASDGSSATLNEDEDDAPVSLENSTFQIPTDALSFSFNYSLIVGADNEDYFDFYADDLSYPIFSVGGGSGSYSGRYNLDVTAFRGGAVPIIFALYYGWDDSGFDSTLTISNVQINPVPEPGTLLLVSAGLAGLAGLRKRYRSKNA